MNNTSTVNLKTLWLFLFWAITPFLLIAKSIEKEPLQTFNCPPFVDLVLNCSDDIPNSIDAWLTSGNELFINSLPNGNTEYNVSNDYGGTPPAAVCNIADGGILVTFTANHINGDIQRCAATIFIQDNRLVIPNCPIDNLVLSSTDNIELAITAWLTNSSSALLVAATNAEGCDGEGDISISNDYNGITPIKVCNQADGGVLVTFTAADECGNTATCQGSIIILENQAPLLDCFHLADITLACNEDLSISNTGAPVILIEDSFNPSPSSATLTFVDDNTNLDNCTGTILRTWTADVCGFTSTCVQTITLVDDNKLTVDCDIEDVIFECDGRTGFGSGAEIWNQQNFNLLLNCAESGCGDIRISVERLGGTLSDECGSTGAVTIAYTITDGCNNRIVKYGQFTQIDSTPPTLKEGCNPEDLSFYCEEADANRETASQWNTNNINKLQAATCIKDICNSFAFTVTSDFDISQVDMDCNEEQNVTVTYTIADVCNNFITRTATITKKVNASLVGCEQVQYITSGNMLTLDSIIAPNPILKIFDPNWQIVFECSGNCPETVTLPNLVTGDIYHTDIQLYAENWSFICEDKQDIEIMGGGEPCDTSICQGDVVFRTQAEVDAFCGCEVIEGDLVIGNPGNAGDFSSSDIDDISQMIQLKEIKGQLNITRTQLLNFNGLNNLSNVGGNVFIGNNLNLKNFQALENFSKIGGALVIDVNDVLESLQGLEKIDSVINFVFSNNPKIKNLSELTALKYAGSIKLFASNLEDISVFNQLENKSINQLSLGGNLLLKSLDGLENLESATQINIDRNFQLADIDALRNLKEVTNFFLLKNNPLLSGCCSITHLVDENLDNGNINGTIDISDNINFCNSIEEILTNCQTPPPLCEDIEIITQNNQIIVSGLTAPNEIVKVFDKDYNIVYQCVANCEDQQMAGTFPLGNYIIDLQLYDENWGLICAEQRTVILDNTNPCNTIECETTPPVLSDVPADMTVSCDDEYNEFTNVIATDNCDTDVTIEYEEIRTDGNCEDTYVITRIWTAIDDCGNSSEAQQVIHIQDNTAPVLVNIPADLTTECETGLNIPLNITATDNCDSNVEVSFSEEFVDGNCQNNFSLIRTWTATDNCGNTSTSVQILVSEDTTPPVLTDIPADLTINPADDIPLRYPIVSDLCTLSPDISIELEDVANETETEIVRTFTATDNCGNSATAQQIITIIQNGNTLCDDIIISTTNNEITFSRIDAPNVIVKVFDAKYQIIFECTASCESELVVPVMEVGVYHTDVQFYNENWGFICEDKQDIEVIDSREPCDTSVCQGDVIFRTQADVDAFCGCEVIEGDLIIEPQSTVIENIENLISIKKVKGDVVIKTISNFKTLEGLNNLSRIDKRFYLYFNDQIKDLDPLLNLTYVGGGIDFYSNPALEDISGLRNLKYLGGLVIYDSKITSTNTFNNLENNKLDFLGFSRCLFLKELSGFGNIDSINGELFLYNNPLLESIDGLVNLKYVKGSINIEDNPLLVDCCIISPFFKSPNDNQYFTIQANGKNCNPVYLIDSCSIAELSFCEEIDIDKNRGITITNLTAPIEIIKVFDANYSTVYECFADCEEAINITDLTAGTYHISINAYDENWQPICERTESVAISGNAQDRNIEFEPADFALYPNPATTETFIDLSKLKGEKVELSLFNQFGQQVNQQVIDKVLESKEMIDLSTTPNGLYILKIKAKNRKAVAKKILVSRLY